MAIGRDLMKWAKLVKRGTGYLWSITSWELFIKAVEEMLMHNHTDSIPCHNISLVIWDSKSLIPEHILNEGWAICLGWICENLIYYGLCGDLEQWWFLG